MNLNLTRISIIGFSCNLLKSDMEVMILSADTAQSAQLQIEAGVNKIASVLGPASWERNTRGFVPGAQAAFAVVIDGDTLRHALSSHLKPLFLNLATQCETVVCCRVSPAQKALVVKLVCRFLSHVYEISTWYLGQRGPKCDDSIYRRRCQRCGHDSRGKHRLWSPRLRRFSSCHVRRLCLWTVPFPHEVAHCPR